jgi:hypothetical protein
MDSGGKQGPTAFPGMSRRAATSIAAPTRPTLVPWAGRVNDRDSGYRYPKIAA